MSISSNAVQTGGKNLGHQLASLNLSITVTLAQPCRTHSPPPAGRSPPDRTRSVQPPHIACQEARLTACRRGPLQCAGPRRHSNLCSGSGWPSGEGAAF
ncbi:hypothetical protein EYF80_035018 [Liparis tanakae]|uniref:Uncharacterized protein n=1 Tax=Liparis tanakae TaxID=230148 RepID=A0A4Z2GQ27_9TELE|nr:hypothetical protein EYF80_035018 [Liparis tanakae]